MFSAWMLGFLLVMAVLVWIAVVVGLPQPLLGLAVLVMLGLAAVIAWVATRRRGPPRSGP